MRSIEGWLNYVSNHDKTRLPNSSACKREIVFRLIPMRLISLYTEVTPQYSWNNLLATLYGCWISRRNLNGNWNCPIDAKPARPRARVRECACVGLFPTNRGAIRAHTAIVYNLFSRRAERENFLFFFRSILGLSITSPLFYFFPFSYFPSNLARGPREIEPVVATENSDK